MKHPLVNRTSPIGTAFVGICAACGKRGLTFDIMSTDKCENPRGMTHEQALIEAISPPPDVKQ